jgi:hypothetical protein
VNFRISTFFATAVSTYTLPFTSHVTLMYFRVASIIHWDIRIILANIFSFIPSQNTHTLSVHENQEERNDDQRLSLTFNNIFFIHFIDFWLGK